MSKERIFIFFSAFFILYGLVAHFSFYYLHILEIVIFAIIAIMFLANGSFRIKNAKLSVLFLLAWGWVYFFSFLVNGDLIGMGYLSLMLFGAIFLSLKDELQSKVVNAFIWGLSIILLLSIVEYLVLQATQRGVFLGFVTRSTLLKDTYYSHYLFNIFWEGSLLPRFQGLADEPGRIGTLCGMMLFLAWRMKENRLPFYVFLISGIISFSLAFYALLAFFLISNIKYVSFGRTVFMVIAMALVLYSVQEQFQSSIIERIESADIEDIDNRTSYTFDAAFESSVNSGQILVGAGESKFAVISGLSEGGNAGAKVWIYKYGVISFLVIFISYNYIYRRRCRGRLNAFDWFFLFAFWVSFYQRQTIYMPFTYIVFLSVPIAKEIGAASLTYVKTKEKVRNT